jgi:hypothetical protein
MGIPYSFSMARPTLTKGPATRSSFSRMRLRVSAPEDEAQSSRDTPRVMARISSLYRINISTVSFISYGVNNIKIILILMVAWKKAQLFS